MSAVTSSGSSRPCVTCRPPAVGCGGGGGGASRGHGPAGGACDALPARALWEVWVGENAAGPRAFGSLQKYASALHVRVTVTSLFGIHLICFNRLGLCMAVECFSILACSPSMAVITSPGNSAPLSHAAPPLRICIYEKHVNLRFKSFRIKTLHLVYSHSFSDHVQCCRDSTGIFVVFKQWSLRL